MNFAVVAVLGAALSAGNAELDAAAKDGAAAIAVSRIRAELLARGPKPGSMEKAMLAASGRFISAEEARETCRGIYGAAVDGEFAEMTAAVRERLGLGESFAPRLSQQDYDKAFAGYDAAFAAERKSACEKQAKAIAGAVKPSESEIEAKDYETLRRGMTERIAARQKTPVFEENLQYISDKIVDPVIDAAVKERRRQREYLMRTRCEGFAPSVIAAEIEANLRRNVAERAAKSEDPSKTWGVFPKTLAEGLPAAVERRAIDRVVRRVDDVKTEVDEAAVLRTITADPEAHRRAADSEKIFRGVFAAEMLGGAAELAEKEAPAKERAEFRDYVRAHAASPELTRAVETRIRREVLPKWRAARAAAAKSESWRIWPTLADRTWYPPAELADGVAARSDYAAAVKAWRKAPEMAALAKAAAGVTVMEETAADADASVSAAFDLARNAIAAQNAIVGEAAPAVLGEAKARKTSVWRSTPDLKAIVDMLTGMVEERWRERRVATLWGDGERPANAAEQHAELFPSVRRRIELVARSILEQMEKPKPEPETKPEPEKEPETPEKSDGSSDEEQPMEFSIVVRREGGEVKVKLDQGRKTIAERSARAEMTDYSKAMKSIADKLGRDILKLK